MLKVVLEWYCRFANCSVQGERAMDMVKRWNAVLECALGAATCVVLKVRWGKGWNVVGVLNLSNFCVFS